ncbi:MAG TPA: universal stress protein [Lapillicoccus sp.]|nr:universal stress protein [Lapillicoccus sp.]
MTQTARITSATSAPPIVVAVDNSPQSRRALDWAVADATSRSVPLHLLHALETAVTVWSPMMAVPKEIDDERWMIDAALEHVHQLAPDLQVTSAIATGPAWAALEAASEHADSIVMGAHGRGVLGTLVLGSTSLHVANHARCPVVVVREPSDDTATHPDGPVVVGFDGSPLSDDALAYAFGAASQRRVPLDLVIAWDTDDLATYQLAPALVEEVRTAAVHHRQELAEAAAAPWVEKFPQVEFHVHVTPEPAADALVERSRNAALLVVGSRGLGNLRGAVLGSVSAAVLRHAHSPVAVIRPADSAQR